MTICSHAMYANAHEIRFNDDYNVESYLRGLYPMASIMNHSCIPNTRRKIDSAYRMIIKATKTIAAGDELTSAYTSLFLATPARRNFLMTTKKFTCKCARCQDPTVCI